MSDADLNAQLASHEARLTRIEASVDKLSTIMIDLAATTDKLEDQFLRFMASQQETNARIDMTLAAIKDLLKKPSNGTH